MYVAQSATPDLRPWVDCVWSLDVVSGPGWLEVTPADLQGDLVLSLGESFSVGGSGMTASSCWLGPRGTPLQFRHSAGNRLFGIRFKPGGAAAFFGVDAGALVGIEIHGSPTAPWRALLAAMTRHLDAEADQGGFRWLWRALRSAGPRRNAGDYELLVAIEQQITTFRVANFATQRGMTERTLQRRCLSSFGVGPKLLHRIQRAHAARRLIGRGRGGAEIAQQLGFVDQAHLCNELRALHGMTPASPHLEPAVCRFSARPT